MNWCKLDPGRLIILGGAAVFLLAALFPPWTVTYYSHGLVSGQRREFGFLFSPRGSPRGWIDGYGAHERASVHLAILGIELAVVILLTAALYFTFREKPVERRDAAGRPHRKYH